MSDPQPRTERRAQLQAAIAALEAQRELLGNAVVDTALAPLHRELAAASSRASDAPLATQQLKQVTVLFVDVVGSTAIGQRLGPEEIHRVMDSALSRFTAIVKAHGGRVLQYAGDGMLAAFGSEAAHEDDAECAVRAGLDIVADSRTEGAAVARLHGVDAFAVRAGLHTGTVLLGGGVDSDGTIRGATVNIAARMEQSAPPGRLRISHETYRNVRGIFDVSEPVFVTVKGVDEPLKSYVVEAARAEGVRAATRGIDGVRSPMVGRDRELDLVRATFAQSGEGRVARVLTVVGEAGVGKSRLLAEFRHALEHDTCWLLQACAHPRSRLHPYGLLRDMLLGQTPDGEDDDAGESARRRLVSKLAPLFTAEGDAPIHLIGHLIGLDFSTSPHVQELLGDERRLTDRAIDACLLGLRRLGESRPVVVVLDDLHLADAQTLAFVGRLLEANRDTPLFSLIMARPSLFEQGIDWLDRGGELRIDLKPLDEVGSGELADALLQRIDDVPPALRALVTSGAEGNPFYMEELVQMLIDDGVIEAGVDRWRVLPERLRDARIPTTLTGVLQARLDALSPRDRTALQQAAIVGHLFWDEALAAIDRDALKSLPVLLQKRMIVQRDVGGPGDYAFQHHLLHQVTYDGVLKEPRRNGHQRVGAFWSRRAEVASPHAVTPAACRALAEAHDHRRRGDPSTFAAWFDAQFFNFFNAPASVNLRPLAQAVVALCEREHGPEHVETARALTNLARLAVQQRDVDTAEPALRRALAIQERELGAEHLDTTRTIAVLGGYFQARGDYAAAEPMFRRVLAVRQRVLGAEHPLTLGTVSLFARVLTELDRLDEAEALSRGALRVHEKVHGPAAPETASALAMIGEVLAKKGDFAAADPLLRRALEIQMQGDGADDPETGLTMWHLAETLRGLASLEEAEQLARKVLEVWERQLGAEHEWTAWGLICFAEVRLARGGADEAIDGARRAMRILERLFGGGHAALGSTWFLIGRALLAAGKPSDAETALGTALRIQLQLGAPAVAAAGATQSLLEQCRPMQTPAGDGFRPLAQPSTIP